VADIIAAAHSGIARGGHAVHDPRGLRLGSEQGPEFALQVLGRRARIRLRIDELFRLRRERQCGEHHPQCCFHFFRISSRYSVASGDLMLTSRSRTRRFMLSSFSLLAAATSALALCWFESASMIARL